MDEGKNETTYFTHQEAKSKSRLAEALCEQVNALEMYIHLWKMQANTLEGSRGDSERSGIGCNNPL